jgi:hypothetical protein
MAGLLESLFAQPAQPMPGAFQLGNGEQEENPYHTWLADYTGDAPLKRVEPNEAQDRDLKKFREVHPIRPSEEMTPAPAMGGMLGVMPQGQGWPQPKSVFETGAAPVRQTPSAAPSAFETGAAPFRATPAMPAPSVFDTGAPSLGVNPSDLENLSPIQRQMMQMVGPNQPLTGLGPAFAHEPAAQPARALPPQAKPIAVGNYQMPRIGNAAQYQMPQQPGPNDTASTPQRVAGGSTASPAEGAIDLTDAPVGMLSKIWKGIQDNSGLLMGLGSGMLGAPSWATGFSRGVAGANAGAQQDYKQNQQQSGQQSLYTALVKAGVPKQQAVAATMNPELARTLMADYIGTRKSEIKTLKDSMGNERLVAINPYMDQEQLDKLNNGGAPGGGSNDMGSLAHMPVEYDPSTGRDEKFAAAFKAADPINAEATEALLQGRMPATGRNLQSLMKYAARIDPEFNSTTFGSRQNLDKSYFGGGEGFKQLRSANTTIDHGIQLQKAIDDLKNYQTLPGFLNLMTGKIAEQYSAPYQKALAAFDRWRSIYGHELEFALTGKNTVTGTKEMADQFDRYASPVKNQQSLISSLESLKERIGEHEAAYKGGMKHVTGEPFKDMLTNRAKLEKMLAAAESGAAPPPSEGGVAGPNKIKWSVVQP